MIRIGKLPSNYGPASVLGAAMGSLTTVLASKVFCQQPLPFMIHEWDQHLTGWLAMRLHAIDPIFFTDIATRYQYHLDHAGVPSWQITGRFDAAALIGLGVALVTTWLIGRPLSDTKIKSGRELFEGKEAHRDVARYEKTGIARSGEGLKLHKDFSWHMSLDRETTHYLISGGVGSGKTVILRALIGSALDRGDRAVIYDNKGDFTATLPDGFILLAPWDARSWVWDIGKDAVSVQDARELAAFFVKEGNDSPIWHQATRIILAAVIQELQATKPGVWTWKDLHEKTCSTPEELLDIVLGRSPEGRSLIKEDSKTTESILANLSACLVDISSLAQAWGDSDPNKRFSFSEWLHNPTTKNRVVVIQGSSRYEKMTQGYVRAAIALLAGRINSPELGDSKERRIWLCFDEFVQLGKLAGIQAITAVGRSKGIRCIFAIQDISMLADVYSDAMAQSFPAMIQTQIFARTNPGVSADFISKISVGFVTIERTVVQEGKLVTLPWENHLVYEPSEVSDRLGPTATGVKALMLGFGAAHILEWPFIDYKKQRESVVPAAWTLPLDQQIAAKPSVESMGQAQTGKSTQQVKARPKLPGAFGKQSKPKSPLC